MKNVRSRFGSCVRGKRHPALNYIFPKPIIKLVQPNFSMILLYKYECSINPFPDMERGSQRFVCSKRGFRMVLTMSTVLT